MHSAEFEEIAHSGGKIEFLRLDGGTSLRVSNSNAIPWAMYFIAASFDGIPLHTVPMRGVGVPFEMVRPSILVPIGSDREGMFGYSCSRCSGYFRSRRSGTDLTCPYCEYRADSTHFLTHNQLEFIRLYCTAYLAASSAHGDVSIDLDEIAATLPANKQAWVYTGERQQHRFVCEKCKTVTDILGEYGSCPGCGQRNNWPVLRRELESISSRYEKANTELKEQRERGDEWARLLVSAVSAFEGTANDIREALLRLPHIPKRRQQLRALSFQNIIAAADKLQKWFGFDILAGVDSTDQQFLIRAVNRRHLITHKSSVVDDEYIRNTGDKSVRLGQRLRVAGSDIPRIVRLLGQIGESLSREFDTVQWPDAEIPQPLTTDVG